MARYTKNLELLKKDPVADGADTFNIETMLNENWDKIDEKVATGKAMKDHVTNQENPHKVTAEQVGAASSVHSHTIDQVEGLNTALSNKADLKNGQVPYSQTPHLTAGKTVYVATTGSDSNPGTQEAPFRTIQAAINSLPKDLSTYVAVVSIADGTYEEDINIIGFCAGNLDNGLKIEGNPSNPSAVRVRRVEVRSCSAVIALDSFTIIGTKSPLLNIGNSCARVYNLTLLPAGNMEYYYSYFAMNVGLHSNVNIENLTIDLINDQSNIFYGLCNFLSVVSMVRLTIKNCQKGMEVGSSSNEYCSIALFYDQPTFEGNTINITKSGMGSIISGLEGQ